MATITGLTAERMQEIIDATIIDADIIGDHLILTLHNGSTIDAGIAVGNVLKKVTAFPSSPADGDSVIRTDLNGSPIFSYSTENGWEQLAGILIKSNTQAASYSLALTDAALAVEMNSASATILTVPTNTAVAFPIGTVIEIARLGAGAVTIHPSAGVIIRNRIDVTGAADRTIANQYTSVSIRKRATNEWVLVGDIA